MNLTRIRTWFGQITTLDEQLAGFRLLLAPVLLVLGLLGKRRLVAVDGPAGGYLGCSRWHRGPLCRVSFSVLQTAGYDRGHRNHRDCAGFPRPDLP